MGAAPRAAMVLSAIFLVIVIGGAGYVWRTLNVIGRAMQSEKASEATRIFVVYQAIDNLNQSLNEYLDRPSTAGVDALRYSVDSALYEVRIFEEEYGPAAESNPVLRTTSVKNLLLKLDGLLSAADDPLQSVQEIAPQIKDLVITLQSSYAQLNYSEMVRNADIIKRFLNVSVETRIVVLLIVVSLLFVTVVYLLQRRYMAVLNRTQKEMERAKLAAEEANRAKGDFLAMMSHEIRTPMNAITGLTYLALNYERDPRLLDYLRKIQGSANVLLRIINEVLDFSKIESRKLELDRAAFSLDEVFEGLFAIVGVTAQEKGLEILFRPDADVPSSLIGDPVRLGQVLINIGTNAVKFTDSGEVMVSVHLAERNGDRVVLRFSIRDTGIGMTADESSKIFEAFSQGQSSADRRKGGTGLGLAISKTLVEMMGGAIEVQSAVGVGSTFSFTAVFSEQPSSRTRTPVEPPDLRGMRALVVDDNEGARTVLTEMLENLHVSTTATDSGARALQLIASSEPGHFRIVFVDSLMPGMTGVGTIAEIRKISELAGSTKLVLVASDARAAQEAGADAAGLDALLMKPVTPVSLLRTIDQLIHPEAISQPKLDDGPTAREILPEARGARVLVVEDNELNQQIAREILERAAFRVTIASSGRNAIRMLESQTFDAVLMDMHMPDIDGHEATQIIRGNGGYEGLPILAMTANATAEERRRCLESGMDDFVPKPIQPRELIAKLAKHVSPGKRRAPRRYSDTAGADRPDANCLPTSKLHWDEAIARVGGNEALLLKLLRDFGTQSKEAAGELRAALRSGNQVRAREIAHLIKGTAGNLGARSLSEASAKLQAALSSDPAANDGTESSLLELESELEAFREELDTLLGSDT